MQNGTNILENISYNSKYILPYDTTIPFHFITHTKWKCLFTQKMNVDHYTSFIHHHQKWEIQLLNG